MIAFNPQQRRTILSIDGGGMRGVIPLTMLVYLEEQLGQPAYQIFNMVAGTSTGAIIAAGLGLGFSAREILELLYRDRLPKAFGKRDLAFWLRHLSRRSSSSTSTRPTRCTSRWAPGMSAWIAGTAKARPLACGSGSLT